MGADGGYWYIRKEKLRKGLSEEDIALFAKFIGHSTYHDVREELLDVDEWERKNMRGEIWKDWLRFPDGTDFDGKLGLDYYKDEEYQNPPEEVWYWREWIFENLWQFQGGYYWWSDPRTWYVWNGRGITVPTPEELDRLVKIRDWIEDHHPAEFLETWT